MDTTKPHQSATYVGPITDSNRWANFKHRPDDIFICTPPKCGTTWTQAICAMLVSGKVDHGTQPGLVSPWIDADFLPIEECLELVEAQTTRRYIKTHTPLEGIPYFEECTYLVIFRDPRDAYCSGMNHRDNMSDQELAGRSFTSGPTAFTDWLNGVREPDTWDLQSLDSFVHFFKTYWRSRHEPNIHIYHYADMKRDLKNAIASMAENLEIELTDSLLSEMAGAASFDSMKRKAEQFAPQSGTGIWKAESNFFSSGANQQWKAHLTPNDLDAFDTRLAELVPPDEARWLLDGQASSI
jgi:aryl sulfotransferase